MGDDADAVVVATADASGAPSARVVLLRGFDARGFCFYTNYESRKGSELRVNARAAMVFHWPALHRQVRVTGPVEPVSDGESDAYWANRPVASRLSAWASNQSAPIGSRRELEDAAAQVEARFGADDVPRPEFWGGYRVVPEEVEFWLHRDDLVSHVGKRCQSDGLAACRVHRGTHRNPLHTEIIKEFPESYGHIGCT